MTDDQRDTPSNETSGEASEGGRIGATLAAGGVISVFFWTFFVNFWLGPSSERIYSDCLHQTAGKLTSINHSTFPTQIFCETADDRYAGAIYSFWGSIGLSSVFVLLALVVLYGLWMIVRRDKNAPQPTPGSGSRPAL